jgi:hypothetical protein
VPGEVGIRDAGGDILRVGFYGCAGGNSIVRVAWSGRHYKAAPDRATINCPVCGSTHLVSLMWRNAKSVDEWNCSLRL